MKRLIFVALTLTVLCGLFLSFGASAEDTLIYYPVEGGNLTFSTSGTIVALDSTVTKAIIPETIEGITVTAVRDYAFSGCPQLEVLQLPDTITTVGESIIMHCDNLKVFNIPKSLTSADYCAFANSGIEGPLSIPAGLTELPYGLFTGCPNLKEVIFEGTVKVLPNGTFQNCQALEKVVMPQGLETIKDYVFYNCRSLKEINLPDTVTSVGYQAFYRNVSVKKLYLGQSLVAVGDQAFYDLNKVKELILPPTLDKIGKSAFYCLGIETLTVPPIPHLGSGAFSGCSSLRTLVLEEGIDLIPDYCFSGTSSLESLTLPHSLAHIGAHAFTSINVDQIIIPENVTLIEQYAFVGAHNLWSVCFMGDRPSIRYRAFSLDGVGPEQYKENEDLTFHYINGTKGWDEWTSNKTATWDGVHPPVNPNPIVRPFTDVPLNSWFASAVSYVQRNNLMNGVSDTTFKPDGTMNRAMLVTVLWRYCDSIILPGTPFTDVPEGEWYSLAVTWSAQRNLVNGVGNDRFAPMNPVTREQIATIMYRFAQSRDVDTDARGDLSVFSDASQVSGYAVEAMQWAVGAGLINGSNGKLMPKDNATRAQVAAIIMRFLKNVD